MRPSPRWLLLIAAPAAVAIWSGWVGLGEMAGFGVVQPLPGIADGIRLNTAITLPVGVEAYAAFALGTWLTGTGDERARRFARRSALGALALGFAAQVIYHLLMAAHCTRAPWPIVVLVAGMPIVTLAFGTALVHLLRSDETGPVAVPAEVPEVPVVAPALPAVVTAPAVTATGDTTEGATATATRPRQAARQKTVSDSDRKRAKAARLVAANPAITPKEIAAQCRPITERTAQRWKKDMTRPHLVTSKESAHG
jgi:Homeodomain-like domain